MRTRFLTTIFLFFGIFSIASADLLDRGNGLIYDTNLNITFYDHTYTASNWSDANNWAESLVYAGYDDWRLPNGPSNPNYQYYNSCSFKPYSGADPSHNDRGWYKASGELGHLFYEELGGVGIWHQTPPAPNDICNESVQNSPYGLVNGSGPFQNLNASVYWTRTAWGSHYWNFGMSSGGQGTCVQNVPSWAIAVRDGDVLVINEPPVAEAGPNQSIHVGQNVNLDGSGSSDDNTATEELLYAWNFTATPVGSTAILAGADTMTPSFVADEPGDYIISLVVTDEGALSSTPDEATVSSLNTPPTANAGSDQGSYVGSTIMLDGSASSDADSDPIMYAWTFNSKPAGSGAVINDADSATPDFIADLPGTYTVQLIVNDGYADSTPDEVTIAIITTEQYAEVQATEALNIVTGLPHESVTTKGNQTALGNFLLQVIKNLQKGDLDKAMKKLTMAIERTDGCALRGSPDLGGGGKNPPAKDYINNCEDQAVVYPILVDAFNALNQ